MLYAGAREIHASIFDNEIMFFWVLQNGTLGIKDIRYILRYSNSHTKYVIVLFRHGRTARNFPTNKRMPTFRLPYRHSHKFEICSASFHSAGNFTLLTILCFLLLVSHWTKLRRFIQKNTAYQRIRPNFPKEIRHPSDHLHEIQVIFINGNPPKNLTEIHFLDNLIEIKYSRTHLLAPGQQTDI